MWAQSCPQPQGAIVREALLGLGGTTEDGGWQGQDGNMVATRAPSLELISQIAIHVCPASAAG